MKALKLRNVQARSGRRFSAACSQCTQIANRGERLEEPEATRANDPDLAEIVTSVRVCNSASSFQVLRLTFLQLEKAHAVPRTGQRPAVRSFAHQPHSASILQCPNALARQQ